MLGERPIALEKEVLRRRIYAPQAYAPVRDLAVVPIVHSECMSLAPWFPVVWRRRKGSVELVTIRALLDDQRAQPPAARRLLPLRLHAYPFVFDPARPIDAISPRMLDDVFADTPSDVGATITTINHKTSRATTMRLAILDRIADESAVTAAIGRALADTRLARTVAAEVRHRGPDHRDSRPAGRPRLGIQRRVACTHRVAIRCAQRIAAGAAPYLAVPGRLAARGGEIAPQGET